LILILILILKSKGVNVNLDEIQKLVNFFEKTSINKMSLKTDNLEISLEKNNYVVKGQEMLSKDPIHEITPVNINTDNGSGEEISGKKITSPIVGIYYAQPSPGEAPFVEVGQKVNKGDVLCIVEAMKVMNEITAPDDGVIKKIYCENEATVEYGEVLMVIE
jgi:acetyl-CoA carboxylase biotin carboxyl carrier protein